MTKVQLKELRRAFREAVFARDNNVCRKCGQPASDPHHIIDRSEIVNGGYVVQNGISLCADCHLKAEAQHSTGTPILGYSRADLFEIIGSSEEQARRAANRLVG
jgi:5-methylcytosine-specific restriction endonuclease McrA